MIEFPDGFSITWDGQNYRPVGTRAHTTQLGSEIHLIDWTTECPRCGSTFTVSTTITFKYPRRRCDACKAPGVPVRSMRRQLKHQIEAMPP